MENPRPAKVAVVEEVRTRLDDAQAAILTEYRGLSVGALAELRRSLAPVGGDFKVYKNTLVRLAVAGGPHEPLQPLLVGPTAIAFVSGEITAVAKALRDYARANPHLVLKGGFYDDGLLSVQDLTALADLPSRETMLASVAGGIAAPMRQLAALMQALTQNLAFGLAALVEARGGTAPGDAASTETPATQSASMSTSASVEAEATTETESPGEAPTGD